MKVLLISMKNNVNLRPVIPIGMLYIAEALRLHNFEFKMIDLNFHTNINTIINKELEIFKPEFVGISIRNIAENELMNKGYEQILDLVKIIKGKAKIILGGSGFSIFPHRLMQLTNAEYGIIGAGENAIIEILKNHSGCQSQSILSMKSTNYETSDISNVFKIYWAEYGRFFVLLNVDIPVQIIRGCNQKCTYCTYPQINSLMVQKREIDYVIEEILSIKEYTGINNFYFVDSVFNLDLDFTKAFLKKLIMSDLNISWKCCINPQNFDFELIMLMKQAGCVHCDLGIDSFSDTVLTALGKGFCASDSIKLIAAIEQVGIPYSVSLILAGLAETNKTLAETYQIAENLEKVDMIHAFIGERIYPNTNLANILHVNEEEKLLMANDDTMYISPNVKEKLISIMQVADKSKWLFSGKNI